MSNDNDTVQEAPDPGGSEADERAPGAASCLRGVTLYTLEQLAHQETKKWLMERIMAHRSMVVLYSAPGHFKTFLAMAMACCIAAAQPWYGCAVDSGAVVYVAAEGGDGASKRFKAWERHFGGALDSLRIVKEPVQLLESASVGDLISEIKRLGQPIRLIVIDTLARNFVGGDENSAREMGLLVSALDRIRKATDATVLILHHQTKATGSIRGSTALEGAADTIMAATKIKGGVRLTCEKQKDAEPFPAFVFSTSTVALGEGESSLILECIDRGELVSKHEAFVETALSTLTALGPTGARSGVWQAACVNAGLSERGFYRLAEELVERGLVEKQSTKMSVHYRVHHPAVELDDDEEDAIAS